MRMAGAGGRNLSIAMEQAFSLLVSKSAMA